uniref:Uncharacterized protein n=1 Tax=Cyprinodon variegatus TaxID=28743 RepID=A0A3Q2G0H6_CYPVA
MAQSGEIHLDQDKLCCSICLDLMKDPATIPCGHSYCMNCIRSHWDAEDQKKVQSCPQCRQTFRPRPVLVKNTVLAYLMEDLKKTRLQPPAGDGCASSAFEKHKLVKPSRRLQENICSHHSEVMKIFCRTDQHCICYMCSLDEHKGHDTVSAATERIQKQRELCGNQRDIQQKIGSTKKGILVLQDSEKIFADFIFVVEKRSSGLQEQLVQLTKKEKDVTILTFLSGAEAKIYYYLFI